MTAPRTTGCRSAEMRPGASWRALSGWSRRSKRSGAPWSGGRMATGRGRGANDRRGWGRRRRPATGARGERLERLGSGAGSPKAAAAQGYGPARGWRAWCRRPPGTAGWPATGRPDATACLQRRPTRCSAGRSGSCRDCRPRRSPVTEAAGVAQGGGYSAAQLVARQPQLPQLGQAAERCRNRAGQLGLVQQQVRQVAQAAQLSRDRPGQRVPVQRQLPQAAQAAERG